MGPLPANRGWSNSPQDSNSPRAARPTAHDLPARLEARGRIMLATETIGSNCDLLKSRLMNVPEGSFKSEARYVSLVSFDGGAGHRRQPALPELELPTNSIALRLVE